MNFESEEIEYMRWYNSKEKFPLKEDATIDDYEEILIDCDVTREFNGTGFDSDTEFAAGKFSMCDDGSYILIMCDDERIYFENKKDFETKVKRWCYLDFI